ncbi:hypothetical protein HAX54_044057, partial [Datura stramonium]|nr:hypothetical protein [Datura stramonium]
NIVILFNEGQFKVLKKLIRRKDNSLLNSILSNQHPPLFSKDITKGEATPGRRIYLEVIYGSLKVSIVPAILYNNLKSGSTGNSIHGKKSGLGLINSWGMKNGIPSLPKIGDGEVGGLALLQTEADVVPLEGGLATCYSL